MTWFRKRPVVIEAMLFDGSKASKDQLVAWSNGSLRWSAGYGSLVVDTWEGTLVVERNHWVIRGIAGEFYPCRSDIFEATYEPLPEAP